MNRRGFLGAILVAASAPAIVRADTLMRTVPTGLLVSTPDSDLFVITDVAGTSGTIAPLSSIDAALRAALRIAHEKATFVGGLNRNYPIPGDVVSMPRHSGDTIRIRLPERHRLA